MNGANEGAAACTAYAYPIEIDTQQDEGSHSLEAVGRAEEPAPWPSSTSRCALGPLC